MIKDKKVSWDRIQNKLFRFVLSVVKGNRYTEVSSPSISFNTFPVSIRGSEIDFFFVPSSSQFFLYFFFISSHPSSDVGASCRASAGARPSPRAPRISRTSWWWSTSPGGLANTNYLYIYLQHLHPFASLPLASSWTWSLVAGMSRRWWSAWEAVWKKLRLSSWLSSWIILIPQLISFPYKTYNANLFQSLAVTNGHHDSKEGMDMKDDNNQEVTQDKCLNWHIYKDSGLWLRWKDLSFWPTVALPTP